MNDSRNTGRDDHMTPAQTGVYLKKTTRTLVEWRNKGVGPVYIRLPGNRILYRRADVDRWLAGKTFQHRAAEAAGLNAA